MAAVQKYRECMANKGGYRSGVIYRSKREEIAAWSLIVVASLGFGAMATSGFSWPVMLVLNLLLATVLAMSWIAWITWGRDRFPLRSPRQRS